jgi:hypothetical protein
MIRHVVDHRVRCHAAVGDENDFRHIWTNLPQQIHRLPEVGPFPVAANSKSSGTLARKANSARHLPDKRRGPLMAAPSERNRRRDDGEEGREPRQTQHRGGELGPNVRRPRDGTARPEVRNTRKRDGAANCLQLDSRRADARRQLAPQPRDLRHHLDGAGVREADGRVLRQEHDRQGRVPADRDDRGALHQNGVAPLSRGRRGGRRLDDRLERELRERSSLPG